MNFRFSGCSPRRGLILVIALAALAPGPASAATPPENTVLNPSYQSLNDSILGYHRGIYNDGATWTFDLGYVDYPPWTGEALTRTVAKYHLEPPPRPVNPVRGLWEWGYFFHNILPGQKDGAGKLKPPGQTYTTPPANKQEAYERLQRFFTGEKGAANPKESFISQNGHYFYQHYGAAWGADFVMSEVGENINSTQAHISFTRGAARQYGKPWGIDMSAWFGPSVLDYSQRKVWGENSGPDNGHSISLFKRTFYASYMAGANYLLDEAGTVNFFNGEGTDADGCFRLSPLGVMGEDFLAFTRRHPDRGIPYTPFAILLEKRHGMGLGWWYEGKAWNVFPLSDAEKMASALFEALWPHSFRVMGVPQPETQYMVVSPFGDTVDVLLEDAPSAVMERYPVLILAGDMDGAPEMRTRLLNYVEKGGILVLGPAHQPILSPLAHPATGSLPGGVPFIVHGQGRIISIQDARDWPQVLGALTARVLPVEVDGKVEYLLNRTASGWIVTLINNEGVTKNPREPARIDPSQAQVVTLKLRAGKIHAATEWCMDKALAVDGKAVKVEVPAGEVRVVEVR